MPKGYGYYDLPPGDFLPMFPTKADYRWAMDEAYWRYWWYDKEGARRIVEEVAHSMIKG